MRELVDRGDGTGSLVSDLDLHLFNEGKHAALQRCLGAHRARYRGEEGTAFAVWAPSAGSVGVFGSWNDWGTPVPLRARAGSGIWEGFVPGVPAGSLYKLAIQPARGGAVLHKADPMAFATEVPPQTASVVWDGHHAWEDGAWMARRGALQQPGAPMSIYEVHLGSWRRVAGDGNRSLSYRELAPLLAEHVTRLGFTHVELLPVMEHPFFGSWGYQVTSFFAPSARFGAPEDLMALIDVLHQHGVGVLLDWVPSHFPNDAFALYDFDGTHLYEHADPRQGIHPDWNSAVFNYGRHEVRSFLLSSARHWLETFHADGLRVDAVASMLYLDYARKPGEWVPNPQGGRENLEAVAFLRDLNAMVARDVPGAITIAEESTAWPRVSGPLEAGGLGFDYKWDMGWMHDTLKYFARDPVYRSHHHDQLTFRGMYAFSEKYVLALSHDECVHGKGSLLEKMPGDDWQKHANLRALYAYQWTLPGKKLLFMGGELGQRREWNHDGSLDWHLLDHPAHARIPLLVGELNRLYRERPALHMGDCHPDGFAWVVADDGAQSVLAYERHAPDGDCVLVVLNLTPVPRENYRVGVSRGGRWVELLNTDAQALGGSGMGNLGGVEAGPIAAHGRAQSLNLVLPPLAVLILAPAG